MSIKKDKSLLFDLSDLSMLELHAELAETVTWQGHPALKLNGLAVLPSMTQREGRVEAWIGAEGVCYPGIAFRLQDTRNYELAYAQPHTSGMWDALQYDPVINGTNTWQLYHGLAYQKAIEVPKGRWFHLRVDYKGRRAAIALDGQQPLVVERLAHPIQRGGVGVWTYLPAYFRDLRVSSKAELPKEVGIGPRQPAGLVKGWEADNLGVLACEPGGYINLNRYLPVEVSEVTLRKRFSTGRLRKLILSFGFSDELLLSLDGEQVYAGEHMWKDLPEWKERGYVDIHHAQLILDVPAGDHELVARLKKKEYFGWGLIMKMGSV